MLRFGGEYAVKDDDGQRVRSGFVAVPTDECGLPFGQADVRVDDDQADAEALAMEWADRAARLGWESGAVVVDLSDGAVVYEVRSRRIASDN